jgi:hypothetical protein
VRDIDLDGEVHDTEDPEVFDGSNRRCLPRTRTRGRPFPEDEPMMGAEEPLQPTGLENEFKTVPGVQAPAPEPLTTALPTEPMMEPEDDEGVFFGDAPEQRVKKTAYN